MCERQQHAAARVGASVLVGHPEGRIPDRYAGQGRAPDLEPRPAHACGQQEQKGDELQSPHVLGELEEHEAPPIRRPGDPCASLARWIVAHDDAAGCGVTNGSARGMGLQ